MRQLKIQICDGRTKELEVTQEVDDYIGRAEAAVIAQTSDTTLRRWIQEGLFPEPVPMTDGSHGFRLKDVIAWRKSVEA